MGNRVEFSQLEATCLHLAVLSSLNRDDKRECGGGANKENANDGGRGGKEREDGSCRLFYPLSVKSLCTLCRMIFAIDLPAKGTVLLQIPFLCHAVRFLCRQCQRYFRFQQRSYLVLFTFYGCKVFHKTCFENTHFDLTFPCLGQMKDLGPSPFRSSTFFSPSNKQRLLHVWY